MCESCEDIGEPEVSASGSIINGVTPVARHSTH